jgi:hypothetical protein
MAFQLTLHGKRVDHGRKHAHVIGTGALDPGCCSGNTAKYIARPDNQTDLHTHFVDSDNFTGNALDGVAI